METALAGAPQGTVFVLLLYNFYAVDKSISRSPGILIS
jgi:hypothetical protein